MLRKFIVPIIGRKNYINHIIFLSQLYRSFLPFRNRAKTIIKKYMIPSDGVVFDIGANIGRFSCLAASLTKRDGQVHSFEPVSNSFRVLKRTVALRMHHNVILNNGALSDKNGTAEISIPLLEGWKPKLPVAHMGRDSRMTLKQKITVQRLDDYCREKNIERIDFIKCDTEGHEYFIFSGALECLAKYKPSVLCEVYQKYCKRQNVEPSQVFDIFYRMGYKAYIPTREGTLIYADGYKKPADYFFIHPSRMTDQLSKLVISTRSA
ncbi:MAG: FkbM family methyltransferase [Candidatus Marinimicrobia bacterium]|nr:FkbM family methyltransferase [Candidatus Neomarinimicrobiota bacterium]